MSLILRKIAQIHENELYAGIQNKLDVLEYSNYILLPCYNLYWKEMNADLKNIGRIGSEEI